MRRSIPFVLAVCFGVVACSSSSPTTTPAPSAGEPTQTATSPPTTPSTRTAPTTNEGASVTASLPTTDEHAVRQVHARFMAMFAVIGDPPNPDHPEIVATTTGAALARLRDNLAARKAEGRRTVGGPFRRPPFSRSLGARTDRTARRQRCTDDPPIS